MIKRNLYKIDNKPIVVGAGLVALDVVIGANPQTPTQFLAGGSCGNVLTILSYLGWTAFPVARLSNNMAAQLLSEDLEKWDVREDLMSFTGDGSTPIIIHRILKDVKGTPKHRFEFRNPEDGSYLPSYKPCLAKAVPELVTKTEIPLVYFFDRINRSSIDLAKFYKSQNTFIVFEPSNAKEEKAFRECVANSDVVKFSSDRIADYDQIFPVCTTKLEIQTLGTGGLKYRCQDEEHWTSIEGFTIDNVVDAAGAGDWCTAGMIWHLYRHLGNFDNITKDQINSALKFAQVLSALNCTFEGARGLMYNVGRTELLLYVQHIIESNSLLIHNRPETSYKIKELAYKISSLFAAS